MRALGKPGQNTTKYYAAREIEELANDPAWLSKATQTLSDHWRTKNDARSNAQQKYDPYNTNPVHASQDSVAKSSTI